MKLDTDRVMSLSALVVGVGSLFIIVYQTQLMREVQSASVYPHVMLAISSNDENVFFTLRNAGVGPARIDDVRVVQNGHEYVGDAYEFYARSKPAGDNGSLSIDRIMPGRLIPAGETVRMLGRGGPQRVEMLRDLLELFEIAEVPRTWLTGLGLPATSDTRAVLEITYSSVYGDRWRVRSNHMVPAEQ